MGPIYTALMIPFLGTALGSAFVFFMKRNVPEGAIISMPLRAEGNSRWKSFGILASTDPVALDQACVDIINQQKVTATNDPTDLLSRIDRQHSTHTINHAEAIGLGTRKYHIVIIDK